MSSQLRKIVLVAALVALLMGGGAMSFAQCEATAAHRIYVASRTEKTQAPHLTEQHILRTVKRLVALRAWLAGLAAQAVPFCGGTAPPCWVCQRESHCTYGAFNPTGCSGRSCYGKWQMDPLTFDATVRRMGRLDLVGHYFPADPKDQDRIAIYLWANGAGCSNWSACA